MTGEGVSINPNAGGYLYGTGQGDKISETVSKIFEQVGLVLPSVPNSVTGGAGAKANPALEEPNISVEDMVLVLATLQSKVSDDKTKSSVSEIKGNSAIQQSKDQERIKKMEKALKKVAKAKKSGTIGKVFGWIGAAAALVAGAALIATGVGAVAGGLLMAAGVVGIVNMTLQSIPETAKWMANTPAGKAVYWTLFAVQMTLAVASLGAGIAASSTTLAAQAPDLAAALAEPSSLAVEEGSNAYTAWQTIKVAASLVTAAGGIGQGSAGIAESAYAYEGTEASSDAKKIAAELAKLQGFIQDETKRLKELLDEAQQGVTVSMQILNGVASAKQDILKKMKPTV
ncbi:MAG: YopB/SseC family type III secretion system translocon subunit [Sulfitobacter sp.]|nr:YopB/SseC family type III secretion system translocon subunit [Sulfitobacter sp.]